MEHKVNQKRTEMKPSIEKEIIEQMEMKDRLRYSNEIRKLLIEAISLAYKKGQEDIQGLVSGDAYETGIEKGKSEMLASVKEKIEAYEDRIIRDEYRMWDEQRVICAIKELLKSLEDMR